MGIRFESNTFGFARRLLAEVFGKRPLFIDGRWDIFFFGCPCRKDGDPGNPHFQLNIRSHRQHLIQKIESVYKVSLESEALLNGSGCIGGLARHVEELYETSGSKREKEQKEKEAARVSRLQDAAHRLFRMGILRGMSSGDVPAHRADCIYREAEREGSLPRLKHPPGDQAGLHAG